MSPTRQATKTVIATAGDDFFRPDQMTKNKGSLSPMRSHLKLLCIELPNASFFSLDLWRGSWCDWSAYRNPRGTF